MKIAYLDCFSGISGDMVLGAFVDCGLRPGDLKKKLSSLNLKGFDLVAKKVRRADIWGTKVDVIVKKEKRFPSLKSIFSVIDDSKFEISIKEKIKKVFENLAHAESKVHRESPDKIQFHQLGEMDTIIDIAGCVCAMELLGIEKMYSSPLTIGGGRVNFEDESLPLPAPATLELIRGRTINFDPQIRREIVTPTGAAILKTLTREISDYLPMRISSVGYGAGTYETTIMPNFLRVIMGDSSSASECVSDVIKVIEANIDDMLPFNFDILFERLFDAGALDVYTVPINMKKMRPGVLLNVQTEEKDFERILSLIFKETTTLGVRFSRVNRRKLERKTLNLKTNYGIIVKVKIGILEGKMVNISPEYEDCKKIAIKNKLPFKTVYDKVKTQALKEISG